MHLNELDTRVRRLQACPLALICETPDGKIRKMSLAECAETGSRYIHLAMDELDLLLARELAQKKEPP